MKKKKFLFIGFAFILLILLFYYFYTTYYSPFLTVIFTNSVGPDSELVFLNKYGNIISQKTLKAKGIFQIIENRGNIYLPVRFQNKLFKVYKNGNIEENEISPFPMDFVKSNDIELTLYNTELTYGTLEVKDNKKTYKINLDGVLTKCTFDENHIYVRGDVPYFSNSSDGIDKVGQMDSYLYVIDRKKGQVLRKLKLSKIIATRALEIIDNNLWIGTRINDENPYEHIMVLNLENWTFKYIPINPWNLEGILEGNIDFHADEEYIYITNFGNLITILDRKTLEHVKTFKIPQIAIDIKFNKDKAFILSQEGNTGQNAEIGVYELPTWHMIKKIHVSKIRQTMPQSFHIIK